MYSSKKIVCLILLLVSVNSVPSFGFGLVEPSHVSTKIPQKKNSQNTSNGQKTHNVYSQNSKLTEKEEEDSVQKKSTSIATLIAGLVKSIGDFCAKAIISLIHSLVS
jgi:predicted PurR-regulated permease PerM